MKRSKINKAISNAKEMMDNYSWVLPKWGNWSKDDYKSNPKTRKYLKQFNISVSWCSLYVLNLNNNLLLSSGFVFSNFFPISHTA